MELLTKESQDELQNSEEIVLLMSELQDQGEGLLIIEEVENPERRAFTLCCGACCNC